MVRFPIKKGVFPVFSLSRPAGLRRLALAGIIASGAFALTTTGAEAVPAYAAQTGQPCMACHIGAWGPQLTPFGRAFKLGGYTMRAGDKFTAPVSAIALFSFVHSAKDLTDKPGDHLGLNDNAGLDHASIYFAGGIGDHFGGFFQTTYDGVGNSFSWDMLDVRAVTHATVGGADTIFGLTVTNAPGMEDVWNTLSSWSFPYIDSDMVPAPDMSMTRDGMLMGSVLGVNAYAYWNDSLYVNVGAYWTPGSGFMKAMGTDASDSGGPIDGVAPYFRVAYTKDYGDQNFEIGGFGVFQDVHPTGMAGMGMGGGGMGAATTKTDSYADVGFDASYQYLGDGNNIYTANMRYTHESQDLNASYAVGNATHLHNSLDDLRFDASYYWHNTYGATISAFDTWGASDPLLYGGNRVTKPDSQGFIFQVDGTLFGRDADSADPRFNIRVGLQYYLYTSFNGASTNYDGAGRDASDNNTVRIFTMIAL